MTEYQTLTALMAGREPGSVKVRRTTWPSEQWARPGMPCGGTAWAALDDNGGRMELHDKGPWLLVSEDAPTLDTLRLEIAGRVLAAMHAGVCQPEIHNPTYGNRHAYALAEADALIKEARK